MAAIASLPTKLKRKLPLIHKLTWKDPNTYKMHAKLSLELKEVNFSVPEYFVSLNQLKCTQSKAI